MRTFLATFLLLSGAASAQEGFSPTLPWGTRTQSVQAGDIRNNTGFSPTMPYVKVSDQQAHHDNPHQDPRYCPNNGYRPYGYYNNYYYGPGSGYYYNNYNGYGQTATPTTPNQGIPGYDTPLPSTPPPGY